MLWSSGGFTLRHLYDGRIASTDAPYGVIGRDPAATLRLNDPAVSSRHVYLHLDRRGLFAVDLATRSGTYVGASGTPSGWLAPGDRIEVARHKIEVVEVRLGAEDAEGRGDSAGSPLDDTGDLPFVGLSLHPDEPPREPLRLNSELVFAGRSASCAVPVHSPSAMRVQCVLVRTLDAAYVVDIVGRGTWRNNRPVRGAERLLDGDSLMIGSARYQCHVEPPGGSPRRLGPPALSLGATFSGRSEILPFPGSGWGSGPSSGEIVRAEEFAPPLDLVPPEARAAVLGWLMGQIQMRLDDAHRRQHEFQTELIRLVAEIHRDNHAVLQKHLERSEAIHEELEMLRDEMRRRFNPDAPKVAALQTPRPQPLKIAPIAPPEDPEAAASWLINRVNQLDQESRSSWKDLIGRISGRKPAD